MTTTPDLIQKINTRLKALSTEAATIEAERRKLAEARRILRGQAPAKKRGRPVGSKNKTRVA